MAGAMHPSQDPVIAEFKEMLNKCTLKAACGHDYVLTEKFTNWMRSPKQGFAASHASRLLEVVYRSRSKHSPGHPISAETLCRHKGGCLLIFSILLELGRGELIASFQRQGIDDNLPIDLRTLRDKLGRIIRRELPDPEDLANKFDQIQWKFCPKQLSLYMDRELPDNTIIPIHKKHKIKTGGTAEVWMIMVLEEFVSEDLRKVVKSSGFHDPNDDLGYRYQFALKIFEEGNRSYYQNEKLAFNGLRDHHGVVRYLGDYGLKQAVSTSKPSGYPNTAHTTLIMKNTYNILLEYGDMDLEDFFYERLPPLLEIEVESFWTAMLDVAVAVEGIHDLKADRSESVDKYRGWHADIKPDNILSVDGKFKLCDPGFARFVKMTGKDDVNLKQYVLGGTETYGAPERRLADNEAVSVSQTIDIWSLGCVFSVAATWVVLREQGIRQFSLLRRKAVERIIKESRSGRRPSAPGPKLNPGDYFHDGQNVLDNVKDWHEVLRNAVRKNDHITSRVLDLVDQGMLHGNAETRWSAEDVTARLKQILAESESRLGRECVSQEIMEALIAVDEAAPSKAGTMIMEARHDREQHLTIADARQARKSKRLDLPLMKTSHRSEGRKSTSLPPIFDSDSRSVFAESPTEVIFQVPEGMETPTHHFQPSQGEETDVSQRITYSQNPPSPPVVTAQPRRPALVSRRRTTPQDVFQAREAIAEREKHNYLKRTRKDERLSAHYGNRDIKFLVDNAETMKPFWYEATYLLETLVMKAVGQDEDGMDLYFTHGRIKVIEGKKSAEFVSAMKEKEARPMVEARTDMSRALGEILSSYLGKARRLGSSTRNLTVIVFTDGRWEGMSVKDDVRKLIIKFVPKLKEVFDDLKTRPVSIEFIQFGDDADATYRLQQLDSELKWDGVDDIIDHEPSKGGDVYKMMLGSFVEIYDDDIVDDEEADIETESSVHETDFQKQKQGNGRSIRSSIGASPDTIPRTIPQVMEKVPGRSHTRQSTLDSSPGSPIHRSIHSNEMYRT